MSEENSNELMPISELLGFSFITSRIIRWLYLACMVCLALPFIAGFFCVLFAVLSKLTPVFKWSQPFAGFMTAFTLIWFAHYLAPEHRRLAGMLTLVCGSWAAQYLLEPSWYPDWHPRGYQGTHIPLAATISGGFIGLSLRWTLDSARACLGKSEAGPIVAPEQQPPPTRRGGPGLSDPD